jgi:hypothetical protein
MTKAVVVLECSQLRTPDEFWDLCSRQIGIDGPDALRIALVRGDIMIELHNTEGLERSGHVPFVTSLERPGLRVIRKATPPRGRLYQHSRLVSRELDGAIVERARCAGERLGAVIFDDAGTVVPTVRIGVGADNELRLAPEDPNDIDSASLLELR